MTNAKHPKAQTKQSIATYPVFEMAEIKKHTNELHIMKCLSSFLKN